jgi:tripartite ATP-independent transporter DctM subunit
MTLVAILVLLLILVLAVPVAAGLGWLGLVLNQFYSPISLIVTTGEVTWSTTTSFILVAVPFYVLMGEIMLRTGMAERMYAAIAQWVSWLPGGLMHSNVVACAVWGAPSGSSVATAVTVGTVAMGEIKKHKYNEPLFLGTIAAGGTLGILIPPSINMVVYGAMTDTSIPKLYLAGFIPGLVLSILFMATVLVACLWRPAWGGTPIVTSWEARIRTLPGLLPPLVILAAVIGSIYIGWATATEAAALGILAAFAYAAYERSLSWKVIGEIFEGTARTTGMIMAIVIGAYFLNVVITTIGLPNQIGTLVKSLNLSPLGTLMLIIVFYIILGMFMETLSMMVATVPIISPIMFKAGYDPVWFGIIIIILMELAMITPPVGINLYVVQGLRKRGRIDDVIIGASPFIITMALMIIILAVWPQLALWLPRVAAN